MKCLKGVLLLHPSSSPLEIFSSAWRNRHLIQSLVKRDVLGRYQGSMLGVLWSFFNPLLMLLIYTFVFSVVFKARWNAGGDSKFEFALVLFSGMLVFNLFAECFNRAPTHVLSNANYVKKIVFPLEVLALAGVASALFHFFISLAVWLVAYCVAFGTPHSTVFLLPIVLVPLVMVTLGFSWFLSSIGVFLRDVTQFVGIATTALMFLSPIFYPSTALPEDLRWLLYLNPMTPIIEFARDVLYWGRVPSLVYFLTYAVMSFVFAWAGFVWFQKTRKGFADVI